MNGIKLYDLVKYKYTSNIYSCYNDSNIEYIDNKEIIGIVSGLFILPDNTKLIRIITKTTSFYYFTDIEDNFEIIENHNSEIGDIRETFINTTYNINNIDLVVVDNELRLIVYYDEIEISNRNNESHTIRGLFVSLTIDVLEFKNNKCKISVYIPKGIRSKMTKDEYNSRYSHSHLNSSRFEYRDFCMGSSNPILEAIHEINSEFSSENLDLLLFGVDSYVAYESLEGLPFHKIANIGSKSKLYATEIERLYKESTKYLDKFKVDFEIKFGILFFCVYVNLHNTTILNIIANELFTVKEDNNITLDKKLIINFKGENIYNQIVHNYSIENSRIKLEYFVILSVIRNLNKLINKKHESEKIKCFGK